MKTYKILIILSIFLFTSCVDFEHEEITSSTEYTKNAVMDLDPGVNSCLIGLVKTENNQTYALPQKPGGNFSGNGIKVRITYTISQSVESCGNEGRLNYIIISKITAL